MRLLKLVLTNFRNYERHVWSPATRFSVILGENGAGKTNLLEGISLLSPGRGVRGAPLTSFLRHGAEIWGIKADLSHKNEMRELSTGLVGANGSRRIFQVDGQPARSQADIAPLAVCVWLTPQMDRLFIEAATGRRRFLDRLTYAIDPIHARELAAYERALAERRRLLESRPDETDWLNAIETRIAQHSVAIVSARMALIDAMNCHRLPFTDFPQSRMTLACPIADALMEFPALSVEDRLRDALMRRRAGDREKRSTSVGAHRTDLLISDLSTGRLAAASSTGQQKAMLLGIVLMHALLLVEHDVTYPLLLLDEPLNHLDLKRRLSLLEIMPQIPVQVIATGTDEDAFAQSRRDAHFTLLDDAQQKNASSS